MNCVSIPFIAGQWSLRGTAKNPDPTPLEFQSPSLRGSGRFQRASKGRPVPGPGAVSIPFIAGQWSLLHCLGGPGHPHAQLRFNPLHCGAVVASACCRSSYNHCNCFNPLHCGAVVASVGDIVVVHLGVNVSIPFIAGQWSLQARVQDRRRPRRGSFNPLHCGAVVASAAADEAARDQLRKFQSPSLRGSGRFRRMGGQSKA